MFRFLPLLLANLRRRTTRTIFTLLSIAVAFLLYGLLAAVKNGRIVLPSGMSYRMLVLPETRFMTLAMVKRVEALLQAGATVVAPKPEEPDARLPCSADAAF